MQIFVLHSFCKKNLKECLSAFLIYNLYFTFGRKKRQAEWETYMRRMVNRYKKDVLIDTHKVTTGFCPRHPVLCVISHSLFSSQPSYWSHRFTWCAWSRTGCFVTACAANRTCWPSLCRWCLPSAARSPRSASTKPTSLGCFSGACLRYSVETEKLCLGTQSCVMWQRPLTSHLANTLRPTWGCKQRQQYCEL